MISELAQASLKGSRVLCRIDCDVVITTEGQIADSYRVEHALETIHYLLDHGALHVTLLGHLGRPEGRNDQKHSLGPVAEYLSSCLTDAKGVTLTKQVNIHAGLDGWQLSDALTLLENVRFSPGEENNDVQFAKALAVDHDLFVFDAFATAHRSHASTVGVSHILPHYAGVQVQRELQFLEPLRSAAERPFVVVIGGTKVEDKLPVIESLAERADSILLGGVIANTFLKASNYDVKSSLVDDAMVKEARAYLERFGQKLLLPQDHVWDNNAILDIGPKAVMQFEDVLTDAKTVFWGGNLGKTEIREFSRGSLMIADFLSRSPEKLRVVAGGDTLAFLHAHAMVDKMTFASTGGGATLEYLAGKELPALQELGR